MERLEFTHLNKQMRLIIDLLYYQAKIFFYF